MTQVSFDRRQALGLLGAAGLAASLPGRANAAMMAELSLYGPPAGPSVALSHAVSTGLFAEIADSATMTAWRSPDELRAGLTSGAIQISVVPVQAAANLYNRGFPIRLANVMTNGLLYVISEDASITSIADLAGRSMAVPFRGDTPEIILGQLFDHHGIDPEADTEITYAATPLEAMQLLLSGRVEAALTAEPSTTAGVLRGRMAGKEVSRVINIQDAWGEMTGEAPVLPQAGLAVTLPFLEENGDAMPGILGALETATAQVLADPANAVGYATEVLGMPAPLLAASVVSSNLVTRAAPEARGDIERMLQAMAGEGLERIGGAMPGDDFYLQFG